jgi:orotidine-5'-phosphate decarboxylase
MKFSQKVRQAAHSNQSWLCLGLDPDPERLPHLLQTNAHGKAALEFNRRIIEATHDLVCAYKLNSAFYEALGPYGMEILQQTRDFIPQVIPAIWDAKRGDIANTSHKYAQAAFEVYGFDAITVNPYLGYDSLEPFFSYRDRGVFLLCRTSNPGAQDLQDVNCEGRKLYQLVAEKARLWAKQSEAEIGLVVGATYPDELRIVREIVTEEMLILVPGVGTQKGDLKKAVCSAANSQGERAIISVSRGVLYASNEEDFAQAARREAQRIRDEIHRYRKGSAS